jgi:hypothetical protein
MRSFLLITSNSVGHLLANNPGANDFFYVDNDLAENRNRTGDLHIYNLTLSQLSYHRIYSFTIIFHAFLQAP